MVGKLATAIIGMLIGIFLLLNFSELSEEIKAIPNDPIKYFFTISSRVMGLLSFAFVTYLVFIQK
jgi:ABC-type lipoprotein release transport system permease subunit